jgi:DHA3 family macrolide efflux protein-like MFS transporter
MLLAGVVLGLAAGLLAGGRLQNLVDVRFRWAAAIFLAVVVRFGTELAVRLGIPLFDALRIPLFALGFGVLFAGLWVNRDKPGLLIAAAGVLANGAAVVVNGGYMPVWRPALELAGFTPADLVTSFYRLLPEQLGAEWLLLAGPFADIIPIPVPFVRNVASMGDVMIAAGLSWFLFSTLLEGTALAGRIGRSGASVPTPAGPAAAPGEPVRPSAAGPAGVSGERAIPQRSSYANSAALDSPVFLGGTLTGPSLPGSVQELPGVAPLVVRISAHPFARLALDARFSAFWFGQTVSLFGDRLHQIALAVLVYGRTGSPLLTGLVFLAATLPNLLLSPIAGTLVDRWDQKQVLVVSDLLRAMLVVLLPIAAFAHIALVYPIVFAITAVSLFFRPAKFAVLPRIVRRGDLMAANSATWTSETLADLVGYPLAGVFVWYLRDALPVAFWADAATYLVSAIVIMGLAIPPVAEKVAPRARGVLRGLQADLRDGWTFLRGHTSLFQNTLISAVAQTSIGATIALMIVYSRDWLQGSLIPYPQNYAAIETAIGLGNLLGGIAVGAIGMRLRKGPLIALGFIGMGVATMILGFTRNEVLAIVAAAGIGIANLIYVIPTQTLFAEQTPEGMMGRVVSFRSSLVFGAMTAAMFVSGLLAEVMPVGFVLAGFGAVTAFCGFLAAALPAIRNS